MVGKIRCMRWLAAAAVLAIAQTVIVETQAQFFWDQQNQYRRSRPQSGGIFGDFFSPFNSRQRDNDYSRPRDDEYGLPQQRQYQHQPSESSRAPPPRKTEAKGDPATPTTSIVVMGDDMADWLAYGLEEVFSDSPEVRIVRKNKLYSGLLRYDAKGDLDWWHVARDTLAQEKADYVVMMLGLSDRQEIREKDLAKEAETRAKDQAKDQQAKDQQAKDEAEKKGGEKSVKPGDIDEAGTPVAQRARRPGGVTEFRSEEWQKIYSRRIDDTIAALKSKSAPVVWVGLPSIRGTRSTADAAYLNDLYRIRAERAGITYIDVWDGFVDEAGKYSNYGPDYEGQMRRLRLSDGVFFTRAGAIKLARYVEHELSRYMHNRVPVALPSGPAEPSSSETKPAERPLSGPVIPLTGTPKTPKDKDSDELLGAPGSSPIHGDATAAKVLAKGETLDAPAGHLGNPANAAQPAPGMPAAQTTGAASALASPPSDTKQEEQKNKGSAGKLTQQKTIKKPAWPENPKPRSSQNDVPRPPLPIGPSSSVFGRTR
jgi:hypothetical protein